MVPVAIAAMSALMASAFLNTAAAVLIEPAEHWKYNVDTWTWDGKIRKSIGLIKPQLVIENESAGMLEGYVADTKGTRLAFYDGDQVAMAAFAYDDGRRSQWQMGDTIRGGNFTITIPESWKDADFVKIYIGNNQYTVNDGTRTTPQTWVYINSARVDYRLNATVQQGTTETAQETPVAWKTYSEDSLIDRILKMYSQGTLPVRSTNAGK